MTISSFSQTRGQGTWAKRSGGLEAKINEMITDINAFSLSGSPSVPDAYGVDVRTLSGNVTLTTLSTLTIISTASTAGLVMTLGDCTAEATMYDGQNYAFYNASTEAVEIKSNGGTLLTFIGPGEVSILHLQDDTTAAGTWVVDDALQRYLINSIGKSVFI